MSQLQHRRLAFVGVAAGEQVIVCVRIGRSPSTARSIEDVPVDEPVLDVVALRPRKRPVAFGGDVPDFGGEIGQR